MLYVGEWIYNDFTYHRWLNSDVNRVNISSYSSKEELRMDLLRRLPPGTSEEKVRAFYLANREQGPWKDVEWNPKQISQRYGVVLRVWPTERGHLLKRILVGQIIIFLQLDPVDNSLTNITVDASGFEL